MCGIVGYIGNRQAGPILLEAIRKLEYRGYDSVGMACLDGKEIHTRKDIGKIDEVDARLKLREMTGSIGIAHSRWATHGQVTRENAHPHSNEKGDISLVHNGIIENHAELRQMLLDKGYVFSSDTDTEVIVHLIDFRYKGSLSQAVQEALREIEGSYALVIISSREPDILIAARNESPLIIGLGDGENYVASDVPAILNHTRKILYIGNKETAVLSKDEVTLSDLFGNDIRRGAEEISWNAEQAEKQGFAHYMIKEIFEQPDVIADTVSSRIVGFDISFNGELPEGSLDGVRRIIIVACGTSWHAGLVGEFMLEELAKVPAEVEYASEFRYRDPIIEGGTLIIAISQSGETADTLAAIREAKKKDAKVLSIVNVVGSSIARESDYVLYTKAGPEIGVASTKAFTCQYVLLYLLTVYLGSRRGLIDKKQMRNRIRDLRKLPLQIQSVLDDKESIRRKAQIFHGKKNALYLGRGINFPIALEGALKLKEVSYIHAEGYPAAEMKHGPIALIDKEMPVMVIATKDDRTYKKILSNIQEVKARGGIIMALETKGEELGNGHIDFSIPIPKNSYILTPVLAVIPLQIFAYYSAILNGLDPDKPKNLAKSVTVE